jgi:methionyl aminopeptidase
MWLGISVVRPGARFGDIGAIIQKYAEKNGYSVVREFCGHGIGAKFHEEPQVTHYGKAGTGSQMEPGMIFTIEPMINAGKAPIREWLMAGRSSPKTAASRPSGNTRYW